MGGGEVTLVVVDGVGVGVPVVEVAEGDVDVVAVETGVGATVFFVGVAEPDAASRGTEIFFVGLLGALLLVTATSRVTSRGPPANHSPRTMHVLPGFTPSGHVFTIIRNVVLPPSPTSGTRSSLVSFTISKDSIVPALTIGLPAPGSMSQSSPPILTR
ncbi:hypothetical protein SAMN06272721_11910 [Arthrobacter sp. P2b]|nr:hypothetical protein SAMN06272721_11910 [Arthrobacter sp. P2b]